MRTGSLVNEVMSDIQKSDPKIGDGATLLHWSDRTAATVVAIRRYMKGPKKGQLRELIIQEDEARLISGSEQDGSARYEYSANPDGIEHVLTKNRQGAWRTKGGAYIHIGSRQQYRDPSF